MLVHWIWLAHRPGVSDRMKQRLLEHFSDPEDIYCCDSFDHLEDLGDNAREALMDKSLVSAEEILEECRRTNLTVLTFRDAAYPRRLKNIDDPPLVLYYKGRLPDLDGVPAIAVVGTRKASSYGLTAAKRIGYQIARCGGILVSGMAFGIDGVAMQGALSAGGRVVGVLGCGADIVYPLSNRALFADVEGFGCILSEFPPGTPPYGWNFPRRNRIISGLCNGVLVVEAPEKSGSLITAREALEQGRDVFVVPGNIDVPSFAGSMKLLRDGGIPVSTGWDILSEYASRYPGKIHPDTTPAHQTGYADEVERITAESPKKEGRVAEKKRIPGKKPGANKKKDKKDIDNGETSPYSCLDKEQPALPPEEQRLLEIIGREKRLIDDVIAQSGLGAGKVLTMLTLLAVKGVVKRLPGNYVIRKE